VVRARLLLTTAVMIWKSSRPWTRRVLERSDSPSSRWGLRVFFLVSYLHTPFSFVRFLHTSFVYDSGDGHGDEPE